mmetsp:Transcript_1866/g.2612  ORF Transcript_1866/g.2612 Transcript_1866/m.2612 type:complete len:123 (-) Transcript_1866:1145-1513(-)
MTREYATKVAVIVSQDIPAKTVRLLRNVMLVVTAALMERVNMEDASVTQGGKVKIAQNLKCVQQDVLKARVSALIRNVTVFLASKALIVVKHGNVHETALVEVFVLMDVVHASQLTLVQDVN